MSDNLSQSGLDLYAVVDLSEKKKNTKRINDSQISEPDISMYAVVERESPLVSQKEEQNDNQRRNPSCKKNLDSEGTSGKLTLSCLKHYIYTVLAIAAFVVFVVVIAMIIMIFIKLAALEAASSSYNVYFMSNLSSLQTGKENIINEVDQIKKILREILQKELNIQVELDSIIASLANVLAFDDLDSFHDAYRILEII